MGIQQNIADTMRFIMEQEDKSLTEFSEELEISRSTLQEYLRAKGNPTIAMVGHLAEKMRIDPAILLTGLISLDQRGVILLLLNMVQGISELPEAGKLRFAELFLEMVQLWNGMDAPNS